MIIIILKDQIALIWEGDEVGENKKLTFSDLLDKVSKVVVVVAFIIIIVFVVAVVAAVNIFIFCFNYDYKELMDYFQNMVQEYIWIIIWFLVIF